jgi:GxxExxY protein
LTIELKASGLKCAQQHPIPVSYQGIIVGEYYADILVEGEVVLEIKAAKVIDESHQAQLINYLKATGIHRGLILNFGTPKLGYKRMVF